MLGAAEALALGAAEAGVDGVELELELELLPHPARASAAALPIARVPRIRLLNFGAMI